MRSETDRLTGLLKKGAFQDRVEKEMNRSKRYKHELSLAFIDFDNFKQVNDTQSHARGDKLFQKVGDIIVQTIRRTDMTVRWVCSLFPETSIDEVRRSIHQDGRSQPAFGVVTCSNDCHTYDTLLGKADHLMYLAKENGKNTAEFLSIWEKRAVSGSTVDCKKWFWEISGWV